MERESYGTDNTARLVFVLGWGNKPTFENVQWLVDQLVADGYHVDVFEIPPHPTDYQSEWVDPVRDFVADLDSFRSLSHSTGGLISRFLTHEGLESRVYLSPWWGFHADLQSPLLGALTKIPIPWPILPAELEQSALGDLATAAQVEATPSRMAPTFLREARRGQAAMPPFDPADVVFYTPSDPIVGVEAIEAQSPEANRVAYDGGHELFCSSSREAHMDTLLAAIDRGAEAV